MRHSEVELIFSGAVITSIMVFLEVRKLEKIEGVAYLEGRFKSNKYGRHTRKRRPESHPEL